MKITIVLPKYFDHPIGGYRVQYEYANRLQARGHSVTLVFPRTIRPRWGVLGPIKSRCWPWLLRLTQRPLISWFPLDSRIRVCLVPDLRPRFLPPGDVIVATAWETAEAAPGWTARCGVPFYMVYDYEYWVGGSEEVRQRMTATYRAGLRVIATSPSVVEMLKECGADADTYIPCGIDLDRFDVRVPIEARSWGRIGFPVRGEPFKGTADAVEAVRLLRQRHGERVTATAFGSGPWADRPEWVEYVQNPTDAEVGEFYNSVSVFVFPSHSEGWGLTGMEALACGAALVAADSVGPRDYARHEDTALVVPPRRPDLLAASVERLLDDEPLRLALIRQGYNRVRQFTWDRAVDAFEAFLGKSVSTAGDSSAAPCDIIRP